MLSLRNALLLSSLFSIVAFGCPNVSIGQAPSPKGKGEAKREKHVQKAIRHLEAAGLNEEARRLKQEQFNGNAVEPTEVAETVHVSVQLVEFNTSKMRELGMEWEFAGESPNNVAMLISALCRNHLAKVLASPTLATVAGKKAIFQVSGSAASRVGRESSPESSTKLEVLSTRLDGGDIRLQIRLDVDNGLHGVNQVETVVQGAPGKTIAICGPQLPNPNNGQTLCLFVTPELAKVGSPE